MPDRFIESHIRQLPLFSRIPDEYLPWIAEAFDVMRFDAGDFVFKQGQTAQGMYMFVSGRGQLIQADNQGQQQRIGMVEPNTYLNEAALLQYIQESASLQVVEPAVVLFVERKRLREVLLHYRVLQDYVGIRVEPEAQAQVEVFRGQRPDEEVYIDTRRHWWALVRWVWLPLMVGVGLGLAALSLAPAGGVALGMMALALVVPGLMMAYIYFEWHNDHVIITNQRVIHVERVIHTMQISISETPLTSIIQVNAHYVTADPFSRLFDYGTVELRNAGDAGNMKLTIMPNPEGIQNLIFEKRSEMSERRERRQRDVMRADLERVLHGDVDMDVGEQQFPTGETNPVSSNHTMSRGANTPWQTSFMNHNGEMVYRKHFTVLLRDFTVALLWFMLTGAYFIAYLSVPALSGLGAVGLVIGVMMLVVGVIGAYWADWDWRNDYYIVGHDSIRLIHRRPLWLQNEEDRALLASVDNVQSERSGPLQALLDFGNVRISLLGGDAGDEKIFKYVPSPHRVQQEITRRQSMLMRRAEEEKERRRREEIAEYISVYHDAISSRNADLDPTVSSLFEPKDRPPAPQRHAPPDNVRPPSIPRARRDGGQNPSR
jgi:hypothetical protein